MISRLCTFLLYPRRNHPTRSTALTTSHFETPVALAAVDEVRAGSSEDHEADPGNIATEPTVSVTESSNATTSQTRKDVGQSPTVYDYIVDSEKAAVTFDVNRMVPEECHYLNQHIQPPPAPTVTVRLQSRPAGPGGSAVEPGARVSASGESYLTPLHADQADSDSEFTDDSATTAHQWTHVRQVSTLASEKPGLQGYLQLHN